MGLNRLVALVLSPSVSRGNFSKPSFENIGPRYRSMTMSAQCSSRNATSSRVASPAKTFHSLESVPELPAPVQDSIGRWFEPFAWFDHGGSCWRTWQRCLVTEWALFSETWPRTGMTRNGIAFRLTTLGRPTGVTGFGSPLPTLTSSSGRTGAVRMMDGGSGARKKLATLTVSGNYNRRGCSETSGDGLITQLVQELGGPVTGKPSLRRFGEWMMRFPRDWTALP